MTDAPDILLPRPHRNQAAVLDSPTRWKLINCGGRFGKTRLALIGGTLGHGPRQADGTPLRRGVAQGGMVAWVAPDYPQSRAIWQEEILPRFGGKAHLGVEIRETERQVRFPGGGFWEIRSAESIDALRGHQWDGVIFDEAAHIDLHYAWEQVVSLRLTDRAGWAMFPSTPNGGLDGNADKMIPSYFNRLCLKAVAGDLDPEWGYWHFTTRDNPHLPVEEIERLYRVTDPTSMKYRQEMQAELVMGGGGLAFPEWDPAVHVRAPWADEVLREDWRWYAGLDWGYTSKGCYVLFCMGPEERVHVRWDWPFQRQTPEAVARAIVAGHRARRFPFPLMVGCDTAMQQRSGVRSVWEAFTEAWGEALGAEAKRSPLVPVAKTGVDGQGHRASRKLMLHELLAFERGADGVVRPWQEPRLTVHPDAGYLRASLPVLMQSPVPGDEDVDTSGDDHCLVGETPVATFRGDIPIRDVVAGDRVWTRSGWCEVWQSGLTQRDVPVYDVWVSDGRTLTMTAGHPVWVQGVGFIRCDALRYGDTLLSIEETPGWNARSASATRSRSGVETPIGGAETTSVGPSVGADESICTDASTPIGMDPSRRDGTSITAITTEATTTRPTSPCCEAPTTSVCTASARRNDRWPPDGPTVSMPRQATPSSRESSAVPADMPGGTNSAWSAPNTEDRVEYAGKRPWGGVEAERPSVPAPAPSVISVVAAGNADVFNLTVTDCPEFFANGLLVHNCYDALGYGLWLRPRGVPGVPREPDRHQLVLDAAGQRVARGRVPVAVGERGYGVRRLRAGRTPDTL